MHKVIFDTDPGVDDAMALLFLHHHKDVDLLGVTTVFGNARIEVTTRNALFLKREWKIEAPVAQGAGEPSFRIASRMSRRPGFMAMTGSVISVCRKRLISRLIRVLPRSSSSTWCASIRAR